MKGPPRLGEQDPGFAFLLSALEEEAPPADVMATALERVERARPAPRSPTATRIGFGRRWMTPWLIGLAAIVGAAGTWSAIRHVQRAGPPSNASVRVRPSEPSVVRVSPNPMSGTDATVRVEDLPPAATPTMHATSARPTSVAAAVATGVKPASATPSPPSASPTATSTAARPAATTSTSAPHGASTFREELALLESARTSLAAGAPLDSLRSLDDYERRFHDGLFAQEVLVTRIEALTARGERARAHELGDVFLAQNPASPHANRIRSLLASP